MAYKRISPIPVVEGGTGAITLTGVLTGNGTSAITANAVTQYGVVIAGASNAVGTTSVGSAGQVLQSSGAGVNPAYSTATYPSTTTVSQILYSSSTNVVGGITTANNGVLVTNNTGVPSLLANSGTAGWVLTANSAAPPSWQSAGTQPFTITELNHASSTYVVLSTDYFLSCDTSGGVLQINLPNAPATGRPFVIKDKTGSAAASNITVTTVGGTVTIDGATTFVMNANYQSINLTFNGTVYEVY